VIRAAGFGRGFYDNRRLRHAGYDPVAGNKVADVWVQSDGLIRYVKAVLRDFLPQISVLSRVN
jgi:hypothetical protein